MYKFSLGLGLLWHLMLTIVLALVGVSIAVGDFFFLNEDLRNTINGYSIEKGWSTIPFLISIFYLLFSTVHWTVLCNWKDYSVEDERFIKLKEVKLIAYVLFLTNPILATMLLLSIKSSKEPNFRYSYRYRPYADYRCEYREHNKGDVQFFGFCTSFMITTLIVGLTTFVMYSLPIIKLNQFKNGVSELKEDVEKYSKNKDLDSNKRIEIINNKEVNNILKHDVYCGSDNKEQAKRDLTLLLENTINFSIEITNIKFLDLSAKTTFSHYRDEVDVTKTCWALDIDKERV